MYLISTYTYKTKELEVFRLKLSNGRGKVVQLTGIDSSTFEILGVAAFPSTKRKNVDTPITLW